MMVKWFGAAAVAAVLTAGGPAPTASAADMNMGATCSPTGTSLTLVAQDHKFDKDCLAVPAGQAFTIRFDNRDNDRHNVAILPSHTSTQTFFEGDIVPGPRTVTYSVPALKPGTFHFHCEVHPNLMNGTFVVGAAAAAAPASPMPGAGPAPGPAPAPAPMRPPMPPPGMSMGNAPPMASPGPPPGPAGTRPHGPDPTAPAPRAAAGAPAPAALPAAPAASQPPAAAAGAQAPAAAPAPKSAGAAAPGPARTAAGGAAPAAAAPAAAGTKLPRTGPGSTRLVALAGFALAGGGLSVIGSRRRRATRGG
jgi:LPXTG-motif cell wall-anchored protein